MKTLALEVDAEGIAIVTLNDPSKPMNVVSPEWIDEFIEAIERIAIRNAPRKPMNVVSPEWIDEFIEAIERIATDPAVKGAVITSAKPAFMAGADLKHICSLARGALRPHQTIQFTEQ